jgi:hypothetical protein
MDGEKDEAEPRGVFAVADEQVDNVESVDNPVVATVAARADDKGGRRPPNPENSSTSSHCD